MERRAFLKRNGAISVGLVAGLAGCIDDGSDDAADGEPIEDFPSEPVNKLIPWSEGGGTDVFSRQTQGGMEDFLDETVRIENAPGASSLTGLSELYDQPTDGYHMGTATPPSSTLAWLLDEPEFDITEFEPIGAIGSFYYTFIVNSEYDHIENFEDLRDAYNDGEFTQVGYQGVGDASDVIIEILRDEYDFGWEDKVPYDGGGPTREAVDSDEVPAGVVTNTTGQGADEDGDSFLVFSVSSEELPYDPDLDTLANYDGPNMDFIANFTLLEVAPPGTPEEFLDVLSEAVEAGVSSDEAQQWADDTGNDLYYLDREESQDVLTDAVAGIEDNIDVDAYREQI